ncbi:M48 family metalloprotease [Limibaculum sp. M0105]|uniref:M48 family metalloprotease n=1 Tax=Thermohalobaculum xanthum TaxID=2753746 RepID=A0A8J7SFD8_9RHOB|nr:M48 family metalloprotease [Thermohalobaculum xanthum]MBK0401207.1 M48 family metalloprotease [Thermohalobaculum xanthum]
MELSVRLLFIFVASSALLGACGTTYQMPEIDQANLAEANRILTEERGSGISRNLSDEDAVAVYIQVAADIEPVAEQFCREEHPDEPFSFCDYEFRVNTDPSAPVNATQRYVDDRPVLTFNRALLTSVRNPDELAFIAGHEAGHHIAGHIEKKQQQQLAGALLMGVLMGVAQAGAAYNNPYYRSDPNAVGNAMAAGGAMGGHAYSQTYELESDLIGSYIAARAGYDPEVGARFFAKLDKDEAGEEGMNLWSTHPSSPERIAIVLEANREIHQKIAVGASLRPDVEARMPASPPTPSGPKSAW